MRGSDERTGSLFSYVGVEARLRPDHPLRAIRIGIVNMRIQRPSSRLPAYRRQTR